MQSRHNIWFTLVPVWDTRRLTGFNAAGMTLPSNPHFWHFGVSIHSIVAPDLIAPLIPFERACCAPGPSVVRINDFTFDEFSTGWNFTQGHSYLTARQLIIPSPKSSCLPAPCPHEQIRPSRFLPFTRSAIAVSISSSVMSKKSPIPLILFSPVGCSLVNCKCKCKSIPSTLTAYHRFS